MTKANRSQTGESFQDKEKGTMKEGINVSKQFLKVKEAAEYLNIPVKSLYNAIAPGAKHPFPVKPKRIGGRVRFDIRDLEEWREAL